MHMLVHNKQFINQSHFQSTGKIRVLKIRHNNFRAKILKKYIKYRELHISQ